jgi:phosphate acetyltransferase
MGLLESLLPKAQAAHRTLVLAEGQDPRVMEAATKIAKKGIARVIVLATPEERAKTREAFPLEGLQVHVFNWLTAPEKERLMLKLLELRRSKGMTPEQARETIKNRLYFGDLMVREGLADGLVAGSIASTPDMVRAAFQCVGTAPGIKFGSSVFIMELAQPTLAGDKILLYADSGVNINPTPEQLVDITIATIRTHKALIGGQARVAFISFSTKGSAKHELVDKMVRGTELTKKRVEDLKLDAIVDGELQADAALVPAVAAGKCPNSPIRGNANILIFPDLQSGNIAYKLTERLAGAIAYGPIMQGLAKPVNDLSRGCSADDIVGVAAITVCQTVVP